MTTYFGLGTIDLTDTSKYGIKTPSIRYERRKQVVEFVDEDGGKIFKDYFKVLKVSIDGWAMTKEDLDALVTVAFQYNQSTEQGIALYLGDPNRSYKASLIEITRNTPETPYGVYYPFTLDITCEDPFAYSVSKKFETFTGCVDKTQSKITGYGGTVYSIPEIEITSKFSDGLITDIKIYWTEDTPSNRRSADGRVIEYTDSLSVNDKLVIDEKRTATLNGVTDKTDYLRGHLIRIMKNNVKLQVDIMQSPDTPSASVDLKFSYYDRFL